MTHQTDADVIIVGAGPAGLYAAFQLGIHGASCLLIDSAAEIGGQCAALYADKPVYDMPGFADVLSGDIPGLLARQAERFSPKFRLGDTVTDIARGDNHFAVGLQSGDQLTSHHVVLATGLGAFGDNATRKTIALPGGLALERGRIGVPADTFETGCPDLFAIGDASDYPGKLALLSSAFHEAALMAFAIRKKRAGDRRVVLEYTSTSTAMKALFSGS